ncbi:MAG: CusA/CzcA family heavy metal efflux RND transporter [Flavobacteriales bacterium]|jgi:cobalt-zinc-cadmium resistance protein CzcA|nr:CusA/CzcA family heavy metal efflux RND transporter [Flavobacteriales bacterium]
MIDKLIAFSIRNKLIIGVFILGLIGWGSYSLKQIPLDAIPDITNNQVMVITQAPSLATQEVEQLITSPIEISFSNLPDVVEIRSVSRFGISVITVVFEEDVDTYLARQQITEQLKLIEETIPQHFGTPELAPVTTGLGEVFQYILHTEPSYDTLYNAMDLRTMNDWIVKRQLAGTKGVIEVNGWGGQLKQYEVAVSTAKLKSFDLSIQDIYTALNQNNESSGGGYIEKQYHTYFIRANGRVQTLDDIASIVVGYRENVPILVKDIGEVKYGSAPRFGAISWNGKGEVVSGQALMLKGENSYAVVNAIKEKLETIQNSLPEGVVLEPFMDRSGLIERAIGTVTKNLIEGGLIVVFILVLLLGNFRGGLIVASVIPLALLFALGMMNLFGVSANLMSLGAIDFGLIVDGAVIIVESIVHRLNQRAEKEVFTQEEMNEEVRSSAVKIRTSAAFGEVIILIVYIPIMALVGIEGKTFIPMAQTVSFAILGALILSLTYVPMMCALFLSKRKSKRISVADRIIAVLQKLYEPVLKVVLKIKLIVIAGILVLFFASVYTFNHLGGEFIPTLEEGDFALHQILPPGSSLSQSVAISTKIQRQLLSDFPEIEHVVTKIGSAEVPTDPMPMEVGDVMVKMKPKQEWQYQTKEEMFEAMRKSLAVIPGVQYEFTQPIQMRFNELISGAREDIAVKIYGEDLIELSEKGKKAEELIKKVSGVADVKVEQVTGLPQISVDYNRSKIAQYGITINQVNQIIETAFAGGIAGVVFEGERRFNLVVRLQEKERNSINDVRNLLIPISEKAQIPLKEIATVEFKKAPMQISRENSKRRITVGVNAKVPDIEGVVTAIDEVLQAELKLKPGYYIEYGGQFENLQKASSRLMIAVPIALLLIFILLYFTFRSIIQGLLIFTAIPLSAIGGVYALYIRELPFSISAGIGFIALFGVAVLNGIVLIGYFNQLKSEGVDDVTERIIEGTKVRLRPVLMTALVAALGFLPMAVSVSAGAEVQKPLATVVIGGLLSATVLTLFILPILYSWTEKPRPSVFNYKNITGILILLVGTTYSQENVVELDLNKAVKIAKEYHPILKAEQLKIEQQKAVNRANFQFEKTSVDFNYGQINSSLMDYQIAIAQSFKFPSFYQQIGAYNNASLTVAEQKKGLVAIDLEYRIRKLYMELLATKEGIKNTEQLLTYYDEYLTIAQKRLEAGEGTAIEHSSVAMEKFKMQAALKNLRKSYDGLLNQLKLDLGITATIELTENKLEQIRLDALDTLVKSLPVVQLAEQEVMLNKLGVKVERSAALPELSLGYFNQQIDGVVGLEGISVGLKIPLIYQTGKGKIQAAKLREEISFQELKNKALSLNKLLTKEFAIAEQQSTLISFYEEEGMPIIVNLVKANRKLLQEGETNYITYLNALRELNTIQQEQLNLIKTYNESILNIQVLTGTF